MPDTWWRRAAARVTPAERRVAAALAAAWVAGLLVGRLEWDEALARRVEARVSPPLPSPEELAERLPSYDPRVAWYRASVALRDELARASGEPKPIDPNLADRAAWDRLPGVGPVTARAILALRDRVGSFRAPDDLLAVKGIGPAKLARITPYLTWPEPVKSASTRAGRPTDTPDLNRVDEAFLVGVSGIGPELASRIVRHRSRQAGFRDWPDVEAIEGIGPAKLRALQNATRVVSPQRVAGAAEPEDEGP